MDYTALGHDVGLAQRMESLAEPGHICLSEQTVRLVEGYFQLRDRGRVEVKGVAEPVAVPSSLPMFATFHCIAKRASTIRRTHPAGTALLARPGCPTLTGCEASGVRFRDLSMG